MSFRTGLSADASGAEAVPEKDRRDAACAAGTKTPDARTATAASPPIRRRALLGNPTVFPSVDDDKDEQRLATPTDNPARRMSETGRGSRRSDARLPSLKASAGA
ncbi:hypothetical protein GCM10009555_065650 [Acrocarpospora macrocephala]|uniref:Uncharacterized protein n=1 Tax=Acrocarpospora macrocephala TaxID=150177 RepID=A0A5M3X1J6_9ACTN|nr:hypothetical protein Amac_070480 [Acrocarpospora macrocephala]